MNPAIDYEAQLVTYTQKVFRGLLDSMARPGKINTIEPFPLQYTAKETDFAPYVLGIACTLLDIEVTFSVAAPNLAKLVTDMEFHTNSRAVSPETADYLLLTSGDDPGMMHTAKRGNLDFPDHGAAVILVVADLSEVQPPYDNPAITLNLNGPGILGEKSVWVAGVNQFFFEAFRMVNGEFPLGIDLILVGGEKIACFPRSVTITW